MRTTVTLDPDVEKLVRDAMARRRTSFKSVVNEALRRGLRGTADAEEVPFVVESKAMKLRPGNDPARLADIDDEMEAENYRRTLTELLQRQVHDRS